VESVASFIWELGKIWGMSVPVVFGFSVSLRRFSVCVVIDGGAVFGLSGGVVEIPRGSWLAVFARWQPGHHYKNREELATSARYGVG